MKAFNPEKELQKIQHRNKNKVLCGIILLLLIISIGSTYALYQVRYSKRIIYTKVAPFSNNKDLNLAVYVDGQNKNAVPENNGEYRYLYTKCDDGVLVAEWDEEKWLFKSISNISIPNKCNVYFVSDNYFIESNTFEYVKDIQQFTAPKTGLYLLEAWGAQGGGASSSIGGYGGYTSGIISLEEKSTLYIVVGGQGLQGTSIRQNLAGGYNGGGTANVNTADTYFGSGGGATHIATETGLLSSLNEKRESILIVAGGGGGGGYYRNSIRNGGNAGGYIGGNGIGTDPGYGGSQTAGGGGTVRGSFGLGGGPANASGGGAGYFGGGMGYTYGSSAGGGSSYISSKLMSAVMYCYSCSISNDFLTKTISITDVSEQPKARKAKIGDGYARITYLGE